MQNLGFETLKEWGRDTRILQVVLIDFHTNKYHTIGTKDTHARMHESQ